MIPQISLNHLSSLVCPFFIFGFFLFFTSSCNRQNSNQDKDAENRAEIWVAPEDANHRLNPFQDEDAIAAGKALYQVYCWNCHGETGMGDGAAGGAMGSQPANFHSPSVLDQTDGAIFHKISAGRNTMPGFGEILGDEERWQLVSYVRQLGRGMAETLASSPIALVEDLEITHWMKVAPRAIRILYDQGTNAIWYATFEGSVYRIALDQSPVSPELVISVEDHGISRMQGMALRDSTLLLTGNIRVNDNKGTTGWMMRVELKPDGSNAVSKVFSTVEYGTTNTPFDHGWSATRVSPDGKHIFVVSGSRTDHGEVQDNLGAYPNSRNEPLTAAIFRLPIDAKDLLLPNDTKALKEAGYLYAEGIRNAFDINFDRDGNLFAVSNSGDYDQSEDMFWVREGHHYGFPWVMGGLDSPQQFPDWHPDPAKDPFLNTAAAAWPDDFYNDPDFPKRPEGVVFTPGIDNYGPDAATYRDRDTGKILEATDSGVPVSTFTAHSSPLGLNFDNEDQLGGTFRGGAFTFRYTKGAKAALMQPFTDHGEDLLHLQLTYNADKDNFDVHTYRIAEGFTQPVDAVLAGKNLYVIEYGGRQKGGNIWKVTFP